MSSKPKFLLLGFGAVVITATSFGATYYYIRSGEEADELKEVAAAECKRFYYQESLPNWANVQAVDAWTKDGNIVIEMEAKDSSTSSSYIRRLCVLDREKGIIMIPSIRNEGRWEK